MTPLPELAGAAEAEEFFEALGVPFDPGVLSARRLAVMKRFGLAAEAWLDANPGAGPRARRAALARALREAHTACAEEGAAPRGALGAPRLVRLGRPR